MKVLKYAMFMMVSFVLGAGVLLSDEKDKKQFGKKITKNLKAMNLCELTSKYEKYLNKKVVIEGVITKECKSGYWFYVRCDHMKDMQIFVKSNKVRIPKKVGERAKVYGTVSTREKNKKKEAIIEAIGIEFVEKKVEKKKESSGGHKH